MLTSDDHVRLAIAKSTRYRRSVSDKQNEIKVMKIILNFILLFISFGINAQIHGKYIGNVESKVNFINSGILIN